MPRKQSLSKNKKELFKAIMNLEYHDKGNEMKNKSQKRITKLTRKIGNNIFDARRNKYVKKPSSLEEELILSIDRCHMYGDDIAERYPLDLVEKIVKENNWLSQNVDDNREYLNRLLETGKIERNEDEERKYSRFFYSRIVDQLAFYATICLESKKYILERIIQEKEKYKELYEKLISDRKFVSAAAKEHGPYLKYASKALRNDKKIVLAAVTQKVYIPGGSALEFASKDLSNDKEVVLTSVKQDGYSLQYASHALRNDKEVVLTSVQQDGTALVFASHTLQKDKDVVLAAIKHYGYDRYVLRYASKTLRNDREVILAAVNQNAKNISDLPQTLQIDREVVMAAAAARNGRYLLDFTGEFQYDKEVVLTILKQNGKALEDVSRDLRNDKDVVLAALNRNGKALEYASWDLRNDKDVVLAALKKDREAIRYASWDLQNDEVVRLYNKYSTDRKHSGRT